MLDSDNQIIEIRDLKKIYKGTTEEVLKGINLSIRKGELFGLLGPNSAGKTTLLSIICGLITITSGEVKVMEVDVKNNFKNIRKLIGVVPQEIALYPALTVKENLFYFAKMQGLYGISLKQSIEEFLSLFKLSDYANKLISKCSGGIIRRANLAAGIIHKPTLLFLDEPTTGIDAQSRNLIFEYLKELNRSGTTIIYTTHYIQEAQDLCSYISIIDNGILIEGGTPHELIMKHTGCNDLGQVFLKLTGKELRE